MWINVLLSVLFSFVVHSVQGLELKHIPDPQLDGSCTIIDSTETIQKDEDRAQIIHVCEETVDFFTRKRISYCPQGVSFKVCVS